MVNKYKEIVDNISLNNGLGSLTSSAANTLRGINHRGVGNPTKMNTDNHGLTFFTRPCLNLSYDNIGQTRLLHNLKTTSDDSMARAIRVLLDPWGAGHSNVRTHDRGVSSPHIDGRSPFIHLLTNNLLSISGWPDPNLDTYTSPEGWGGESWSMVDSFASDYSTFDITATFRNIDGDPINALFRAWTQYMTRVLSGSLVPYPEFVVENEIDYMTRIYRIILDPSRTHVQKIGACGAGFPTALPLGAAFNYSSDAPISQDTAQISIPFRCMGAQYNDPILVAEFNTTVATFNASMADGVREKMMVKLQQHERELFNYEGYPRISPDMELEWWVSKLTYATLSSKLNSSVPSNGASNQPVTILSKSKGFNESGTRNLLKEYK